MDERMKKLPDSMRTPDVSHLVQGQECEHCHFMFLDTEPQDTIEAHYMRHIEDRIVEFKKRTAEGQELRAAGWFKNGRRC